MCQPFASYSFSVRLPNPCISFHSGFLIFFFCVQMSVVNATFQSNIEKDLTNECNKLLNTIVYESTCLAESKYTRENTKSAIFSECRKMKEEMIKFNSVVINVRKTFL